ncbi:hypothetical protein ACFVXW_25355 [Streptomyces sp. NPDC058251]|uniref:hypothetical protein n=1 Tax=Streptomyces sp. NPDC058251 TaxID=3346404 RepID=UPI0036EEBAC0
MNITLGGGKAVHVELKPVPGYQSTPDCGGNRASERYMNTTEAVTCKRCLKIIAAAEAAAAETTSEISEATGHQAPESANVPSVSTTNQGETTMSDTNATTEAPKLDVTTDEGKAALEQIAANIERGRVLATEDNAEALEELGTETETLISNLSGKGSIKAKKENRDAWKAAVAEAAAAKPKAEVAKAAAQGVVVAKTWDQYEGTKEFATLGAEKLAEGVRLNLKVSNVAEEVAKYAFEMVTRIPNKDENPDLMVASDQAKKAGAALLKMAGEGFEHTWDNEQALKKFARSVQDYRSDVRAAWLRSLDEETEEAAERRARVAKVLEGKPDDVPASEWVAKAYGTSTIGQAERKRLAYHEKQKAKELAAAGGSDNGSGEGGDGEGNGEGNGDGSSVDTTTPDERATKLTDKLLKDIKTGKPEDFEAATDETKEAIRKKLEEAKKAITAMIAATL